MLIAALFFYLARLFGFGADAPLVIDIKKPIQEYIADPERKTKALAINETMQDQAKAFSGELASMRKELTAIQAKRLSSEAEFTALFTTVDAKCAALRAQLLTERLALKGLMTADEWAKVYATDPAATSVSVKTSLTPGGKPACCEISGGRAALLTRGAGAPAPIEPSP